MVHRYLLRNVMSTRFATRALSVTSRNQRTALMAGIPAARTGWRVFSRQLASSARNVVAIRREESSVWERRAPLNPGHVQSLVKDGVKVLIQPSTRRAYSMPEYERAGAVVTDDIDNADVIIGKNQRACDVWTVTGVRVWVLIVLL